MSLNVLSLVAKLEKQMIHDRRIIHQNPELSFQEKETMEYICHRLDTLGIKYQKGIAGTGILAEVQGKEGGGCVLLRADMDALPIDEKNDIAYKSNTNGVMHACGHDVHTGILLSVCECFHNIKEQFCGTVKFVFQPGEETSGGAKPMIASGILEQPHVDYCLALHVDTDIPVGKIRVQPGPVYASPDDFYITIHGRGGHGAEPDNAINPMHIASKIILTLEEIAKPNHSVVSVCSLHSGNATNVIPDEAKISGTARSLDHETRLYLEKVIEETIKEVCDSYNAKYTYLFDKLFPPLINDQYVAEIVRTSATEILGADGCITDGAPTMAGEDFSYFAAERPSAIFKLGCRNEEKGLTAPIHNSYFDIDESAMKNGAAIFIKSVLSLLEQ